MKEAQESQSHPKGFLLTLRSKEASVSRARVRFLKANVSLGVDSSFSSFWISCSGRFFVLGCSVCAFSLVEGVRVGAAGLAAVGAGRSAAQASQQRYLGGFSNVHVGHVHGASYELLFAVEP